MCWGLCVFCWCVRTGSTWHSPAPPLAERMARGGFSWVSSAGCSGAALSCSLQIRVGLSGAECLSLSTGGRQRCPCGVRTLPGGQDQSLPLCTPVPGAEGVSEPFVGREEPWWGLAGVCWQWLLSWPFSEGSFQTGSCPKGDPGPWASRFPFEGNTHSPVLHVPITFRAAQGHLQQLELSQGGFSPGLGSPAIITSSGRTEEQGGIMARCFHCCLRALAVEQCGDGAVSPQQGGISRGTDHWGYAISAAFLC